MPSWPATLPAIEKEGYSETPPDTSISTTMEAGPPKVRRRASAGVRKLIAPLTLSKAQTQILDDFYVTTLAGGVLPFDWTHPRTDEDPVGFPGVH